MSKHSRHRQAGFTLIELMIVVGILGILAAIGVPSFLGYMHKAKRSEALLSLEEITHKIDLYHIQNHVLPPNASQFPTEDPCSFADGRVPVHKQSEWWADPGWATLEFHIDEQTRFRYEWVNATTSGDAIATGDIDCDGVPDIYTNHIDLVQGNVMETSIIVLDDT